MAELKELKEMVARGLDQDLYGAPMALWRFGNKRTLHGSEECQLVQDGGAVKVHRSPLTAPALCECWSMVLTAGSQAEKAYYEAGHLLELEKAYAETLVGSEGDDFRNLTELRHLQRELRSLTADGVSSWRDDLTGRVESRLEGIRAALADEGEQRRLLEWCALEQLVHHTGEFLGPEDRHDMVGDDTWKAGEIEREVQDLYATMRGEGRSRDEIAEAIHALILEQGPETISSTQLSYLPSSAPQEGETLERYVQRMWVVQMKEVAHLFARSWERTVQERVDDPTRKALLISGGTGFHDDTLRRVLEAYQRPTSEVTLRVGQTVVVGPKVAIDTLVDKLDRWRTGEVVTLSEDDDDRVVETALTLWDPTSPTLRRFKDALDAARRV